MKFSSLNAYRDDAGFWTIPGTRCRVGAVAFCFNEKGFIRVRKSNKFGYEFSGMYALPGGMIRPFNNEEFDTSCFRSLKNRVLAESGFNIALDGFLEFGFFDGIVTSYSVSGKKMYTLVLVHVFKVGHKFDPLTEDNSISSASWQSHEHIDWSLYAPANRIAIFRSLRELHLQKTIVQANPSIIEANSICKKWAIEAKE